MNEKMLIENLGIKEQLIMKLNMIDDPIIKEKLLQVFDDILELANRVILDGIVGSDLNKTMKYINAIIINKFYSIIEIDKLNIINQLTIIIKQLAVDILAKIIINSSQASIDLNR